MRMQFISSTISFNSNLQNLSSKIHLLTIGVLISCHFSICANNNITHVSYLYNDGESRISKIENGLSTFYISPNYEEIWSNGQLVDTIAHFRGNGQRIASVDNGGLKFHYSDHLGSATKVADTEGQSTKSIRYSPYGADAEVFGDAEIKHKYTGQEEDGTGLYYYGARYYDTSFGRFLAADSWLPDMYDAQQLNRFLYVRGNPLKLIDPTGHEIFEFDTVINQFTSQTKQHISKSFAGLRVAARANPALAAVLTPIDVVPALYYTYHHPGESAGLMQAKGVWGYSEVIDKGWLKIIESASGGNYSDLTETENTANSPNTDENGNYFYDDTSEVDVFFFRGKAYMKVNGIIISLDGKEIKPKENINIPLNGEKTPDEVDLQKVNSLEDYYESLGNDNYNWGFTDEINLHHTPTHTDSLRDYGDPYYDGD